MSLPDGEFPSNGRCARAFVGPPLYYSDNPTVRREENFEKCQLSCKVENFRGECDWFAFHPYLAQNCKMYKSDVYGYDHYSTAAEHVWNMAGGDPEYMTRDTYLGQPMAATLAARWRRMLATDAQISRSRIAMWLTPSQTSLLRRGLPI